MAFKIGIIGAPNTGKSYSRTFIKNGEECFIIAPSSKMMHITTSDNKPIRRLQFSCGNFDSSEKLAVALKTDIHGVVPYLLGTECKIKETPVTVTGNYIVTKLEHIEEYLNFVNLYMPHIKTIFIPDFTHFISAILADRNFIKRKSGGEAFQRFWELAGDVLEKMMISIDSLREDLIVVTEYHSTYNEVSNNWEIFVPGGKMLTEKFLLDSYYDFMLYTHVEQDESGAVTSYNFVTKKWGKYNARDCGIFKDILIPNDLELVLQKVREKNGI